MQQKLIQKNVSHVDVSSFALKSNLASLKTEVDKLDIDELTPVPNDLAKLSKVVKNIVNNIDTTGFVLKTTYDADKSDLEKKIPDTKDLAKKTDSNAQITEIEIKIPSITGLATNSALTAVDDKIPNVRNLVKKTDYDTKISDIEKKIADHNHDKYITTQEFNKLTTENFNARLAWANLITKTDFDAKLQSLSKRITSNKTKHLLVENELKKLKTFDLSYFKDKYDFEEDGTQNYLVFQPMYRYFKRIAGVGSGNYIYFWKSKGLSDERISSITACNYSITPKLSYYGSKIRVKFNGSCLKQDKAANSHGTIANIYIVYEISKNYNITSYPTLENCLFGAVSLTKHADIDQYKYSGYGIGFDRKGEFSFGSNEFGRNVIIWGVDMSSSVHANNKKNNILVLGKDFTQGLNNTTIYAEKLHSVNFAENNKFCLSLHYNGANRYLFINGIEIYKFINSEIVATPLCLGNISKDFSVEKDTIKWICL